EQTKSVALQVRRPPVRLCGGGLLEVLLQLLLSLVVGSEVTVLECLLPIGIGLLHARDRLTQGLRVALGRRRALSVTAGVVAVTTAVTIAIGAAVTPFVRSRYTGLALLGRGRITPLDTGVTAEELVKGRVEGLP